MLIAADGEKIPSEELGSIHVYQPGAPRSFERSTLLVGARGVGKTLLLRHRKQTTHPEAAYVNLYSILGALDAEGVGSRAVQLGARTNLAVSSKARALVAVSVVDEVKNRLGTSAMSQLMKELVSLGPRLRFARPIRDPADLFIEFAGFDLDQWTKSNAPAFFPLLARLHELLGQEFALFIDRMDDAPRAAVEGLFPLLSQSLPYKTVMAARVGAAQLVPPTPDPSLAPGDHFDVVHLGYSVETDLWRSFMDESIDKFLFLNGLDAHPPRRPKWPVSFARESLRNAIEHTQIYLSGQDDIERAAALADRRRYVLRTAHQAVGPAHQGFQDFVASVVKLSEKANISVGQRLIVEVSDVLEDQLVAVPTREPIHDFMLAALRSEAIFLPNGHRWHPYFLPNRFELSPLLAWDGRTRSWMI